MAAVQMPSFAEVKEYGSKLYDVESRGATVAAALTTLGAEKVLSKVGVIKNASTVIETVSSMTTLAGLVEKKEQVTEIALPYVAKARSGPEGRKELAEELAATQIVQDGKAILDEKVLKPVEAKLNSAKEFAAPYVSTVKETSAPYVAKTKEAAAPYVAKLEELRRSERVEAMIAAFQNAREHPTEKAIELKDAAIDLIKYDSLKTYREHVLSPEFQQDTLQLIKVDLPAIASSKAAAASKTLKETATTLKAEVEVYRAKAGAYVEAKYEKAPTKAEAIAALEALREHLKVTGNALAVELQAEVAGGVEQIKVEGFSVAETLERLKRVLSVVDKLVVSPLMASVGEFSRTASGANLSTADTEEDTEAVEAEAAVEAPAVPTPAALPEPVDSPARVSPPPLAAPVARSVTPSNASEADEEMKDAQEEVEDIN